MTHTLLLGVTGVALVAVSACGRLQIRTTDDPRPDPQREALFTRAVHHADPANPDASLDSASYYLAAYLAHDGYLQRPAEARAMLRLANDAMHLARVELALREARAADSTVRRESGGNVEEGAGRRDDDALREIQRLRDQLSRANAELERIRKRLANPRPPADTGSARRH